jgi:NTE family protein
LLKMNDIEAVFNQQHYPLKEKEVQFSVKDQY